MRRKVFCSLSQELALFTSLQHIICSISQSQLFSLSYCHTHSTTVYHSMAHLTGRRRAHACVRSPFCFRHRTVFYVYLFSFGCQLVFGSICYKINRLLVELLIQTSSRCIFFYIPHLHLEITCDVDILTQRKIIIVCLLSQTVSYVFLIVVFGIIKG